MVEREDWDGLVVDRPSMTDLSLRAPLGTGTATASSPFLGLGSDNAEWWVKAPFPGLGKALVTELVVGRVGALIGAPVCAVEPITIDSALLPYEVAPGKPLVAGVGSATTNLSGAVVEIRGSLNRRHDDDNRVRHAGVYALVDWCYGSDHQWLQRVEADWELHSHDHGWFLPPSGPDWDEASLAAHVDSAAPLGDDPADLDPDEIERLAAALDQVTRAELQAILSAVPAGMAATNSELESLGWFLERRAPQVAARLRNLA